MREGANMPPARCIHEEFQDAEPGACGWCNYDYSRNDIPTYMRIIGTRYTPLDLLNVLEGKIVSPPPVPDTPPPQKPAVTSTEPIIREVYLEE